MEYLPVFRFYNIFEHTRKISISVSFSMKVMSSDFVFGYISIASFYKNLNLFTNRRV